MGVRRIWGYAVVVAIVVFVFVMMTGCGSEPPPHSPAPGPSVSASSAGPLPSQRWAEMDPAARTEVCSKLSGPLPGEGEIGGTDASSSPDFREALWALEREGGFSQNEAVAMLPYAVKQCR